MSAFTVSEAYQYVNLKLNKLQSNSGDNIPIYAFVNAFNTSQLSWVDNRFKLNDTNILRKEEIQQLLKSTDPLPVIQVGNYYECNLPTDYFHYERSISVSECDLENILKEEANITRLLKDDAWKPSLEWGETLATLVNNKLRVYVDGFSINSVILTYYRFPLKINMVDGFNDVNGNLNTDIHPEFTGQSLIEILDWTCELLAGDTQDQWNTQRMMNRAQKNT